MKIGLVINPNKPTDSTKISKIVDIIKAMEVEVQFDNDSARIFNSDGCPIEKMDGDMIIEAIGQAPNFSFIPKKLFDKLEFTPNRKVKVNENGMTTIPALFAGGDIVNLNLDAVTAVADAKIAAEGIHKMLSKR